MVRTLARLALSLCLVLPRSGEAQPVEPGPEEPKTTRVPGTAGATPRDARASADLAGVYNGVFYVRDRDDAYRLYFQGRAMIDFYAFFGPGVEHVPALLPAPFLRKVRMEFTGELFQRWQWFFGGDFGNNTTGLGPNQSSVVRAAPADVFINYRASPMFNVQVGQFDVPFGAEARTGDKWTNFLERSLPVRTLGKGSTKDNGLMLWGHLDRRHLLYQAAVIQGDGTNRPNVDRRFDFVGRVYARPFARAAADLRDTQVGASARYGTRQSRFVAYDYPAMTTLGGFTFFRGVYGAMTSTASPNGQTHVIPSGEQLLLAAEIRIPTATLDVSAEGIYARENTREAQDADLFDSLRFGQIESYGYYVQLGWWPLGNAYLNGVPGDQAPTSLDFDRPEKPRVSALQLLVKWEQLHAEYSSNARGGDSSGMIDGDVRVNALSFAANYWIARTLRLSLDYAFNHFPNSRPSTPTPNDPSSLAWTSQQRAQAPGNQLRPGIDDAARDGAHVLHELLFRAQVGF